MENRFKETILTIFEFYKTKSCKKQIMAIITIPSHYLYVYLFAYHSDANILNKRGKNKSPSLSVDETVFWSDMWQATVKDHSPTPLFSGAYELKSQISPR